MSIRLLSMSSTRRRAASDTLMPVAYIVISSVRCFRLRMTENTRYTSGLLNTAGSLFARRGYRKWSKAHSLLNVTL